MGDRSPDRMKALGRAALALLIEAVKELVPAFGPIQAAWEAYRDALRPEDLPGQVREMLQNMRRDYQKLLEPELPAQAGDTVAIALREAIGILEAHGLSPEELAAEAGLDPQEAARRTRERAAHRLERLDERARSLAERMIEDYYRVLLSHRDALAYVGIPALQELLRRTEGLATRLMAALDLQRWREAWAALLPVARPLPGPLTPENLLEALRAPYRLVEFTGKAHRALQEEIAGTLKGPGSHPSRAWILWGPGGAGKTRTAVEVALALKAAGWQAFFVPPPFLPVGWASYLPFWSRPDRPTLLIVDYAEQRPAEELRALARAVGEAAPERGVPLALLLLMRADPREPAAGHVADALAEARIRWEARRVPPVEDPEDRQALFRKARARFREALAPPDAPPEVDYEPEDLPRTPLALLALAVLAAHGHRVVQSQDEAAILTDLWEQWEQPRWRRTLEAHGGRELLQTPEVWDEARERIEQALAAASLGRPFTAPEEVAAWWEAYFPFRKRTARGERLDPSWLAERLKVLFPGVGEAWRLPPISPHPLADVALARFGADLGHLVDSILPAPEEIEKASLAIRRLVEGWERGEALSPEQLGGLMIWIWPVYMVREVLPRLSAAAVPGASGAAQAALKAATRWLEKTVPVLPEEVAAAWLGTWGRSLRPPDRTVLLRPFEEVAYRSWVKRAIDEAERARALEMWGLALSALGRRDGGPASHAGGGGPLPPPGRPAPRRLPPRPGHEPHQPGQPAFRNGPAGGGPGSHAGGSGPLPPAGRPAPRRLPPIPGRQPHQPGRGAFRIGPVGGGPASHAGGGGPLPPPGRPAPRRLPPRPGHEPQQPGRPAFRPGPAGGGPASHAGGGGPLPPAGRPTPRRLPPIPGEEPQQPGRHAFRNGPAGGGPGSHAGGGGPLPPPGRPTPRRLPPRPGHEPPQPGHPAFRNGPAGGGPASHAGGGGPLPPPGRPAPRRLPPRPGHEPRQPGHPAFRNGPAGGGPASHAGGGGPLPPAGRPAPRRLPPRPGQEPRTTWASGFPKWAGGRRPCKPRRRRWTSTAGWPPSTPTPSSPTWP
jgi:hypothetical protein